MTVDMSLQDRRQPADAVAELRLRATEALAPGGRAVNSAHYAEHCRAVLATLDWIDGQGPAPIGTEQVEPDARGRITMRMRAEDAEQLRARQPGGAPWEGAVWETLMWHRMAPGFGMPV